MQNRISRRRMLQATGAVGVCTLIRPASVRAYAANEKPSVGAIGAGIGAHDAKKLEEAGAVIAALCEVDEGRLHSWARNHPNAKLYTDFRKMLDEAKLDGVVVATPDHTHAPISMAAMRRGVHCFCQKPLTHNVTEARRMRELAEQKKLATQMGTDTQSNPEMLRLRKLIQAGGLGEVTEVHVGTNRPIWLQGADRPAGEDPVPKNLNWDLWLGPAPERPYVAHWPKDHPARKLPSFKHEFVYHPFVWRGWWDFGTGALGDIAPHVMNII
ncbi:MAG TPA: Gfo/Idh/MocA family oxidoreductase, partial [Thermoguttaceae bacterium]|nr:Gfo/Idh/MocA family oxidoreductase [Thermoguttaceae bacterium]